MRVISGIYKHIKLDGYDIDVIRQTMDKVKESMFAMMNRAKLKEIRRFWILRQTAAMLLEKA